MGGAGRHFGMSVPTAISVAWAYVRCHDFPSVAAILALSVRQRGFPDSFPLSVCPLSVFRWPGKPIIIDRRLRFGAEMP